MSKDDQQEQTAEIIKLPVSKASKMSERKWGKPVMDLGFCIVPSLILRAQRRLQVNPTQLAVLMHLADYWWDVNRKPFPSKKTLGDRLGLSARQVQRYIADLEKMGLVKRVERRAAHRGKLSNAYDLSGLVKRLKELEPEFSEVEENVKSSRRAVAKPGLRRRRKAPD